MFLDFLSSPFGPCPPTTASCEGETLAKKRCTQQFLSDCKSLRLIGRVIVMTDKQTNEGWTDRCVGRKSDVDVIRGVFKLGEHHEISQLLIYASSN